MRQSLYAFEDVQVLHLELTSKCQAACPMCGRNHRGGKTRETVNLDEISLEDFKTWFPARIIQNLNKVVLCGNYGDPIIAADCGHILSYLRSTNPTASLILITNGSARDSAFWRLMAALNVEIHFALDGATAESHQRYRRHTKFEAILKNASTFIEAGGVAAWVMLAFQHNEHEISDARKMAGEHGFQNFLLKSTTRFHGPSQRVDNDQGEKIDSLYPSTLHPPAVHMDRPGDAALASCDILCKVVEDRSVFITADGLAFPCCWIGSGAIDKPGLPGARKSHNIEQLHHILDRLPPNALSLRHNALPVIVNRFFPHFSRRWSKGPGRLTKCAQICGKVGTDQVLSTLVEVKKLDRGVAT